MISTTFLRNTLDQTLQRALVFDPQFPYLSSSAEQLRSTIGTDAEVALARIEQLADLARGACAHREDLASTMDAAFARGDRAWTLAAPVATRLDRNHALARLLQDKRRCFGAIREADRLKEFQLAWALVEALTGVALVHDLGPEWREMLELGIVAASADHQPRAASALHAALAWSHLHDHPHHPQRDKAIRDHSAHARTYAREGRDEAAEATAQDLLAHHAHHRGKPEVAETRHAKAIALDARLGDLRGLTVHLLHRAQLRLRQGRFTAAADDAVLTAAVAEILDADHLTAQALLVQAQAQWHLHDPGNLGASAADMAWDILTQLGESRHLAVACAWTSSWWRRNGLGPRSHDMAKEARRLTREGSPQRRQIEQILAGPLPAASHEDHETAALPRSQGHQPRPDSFSLPEGPLAEILTGADPARFAAVFLRLGSSPASLHDRPDNT
ncbi:hypothetical protein M8C13_07115 [Crossiella sp. SN42]|uniref:hypothetical protein n=1 Tax=Crossiella sp. SN42 TaxID=2944808 RepID=UPI00207CA4FA|nr:hypothetical protein [Crossiella sp. SN42]MCO1575527.1 hypothetical protein [Crossiella sp. SN42]